MGKSKRGGVFGLIRGSVGPATYSVGKDGDGKKQQIIREKPTEVSNPRTRAQALQRMKLSPIFMASNLLSDIVDHSWQGVENGLLSLQHFRALAMKSTVVPYMMKGAVGEEIGEYDVADGKVGYLNSFEEISCDDTQSGAYRQMVVRSSDLILPPVTSAKSNDWASYSHNLLDHNPWLRDGDEVAFLTFARVEDNGVSRINMYRIRFLIDTTFDASNTPDSWFIENTKLNKLYALSVFNPDNDLLQNVDAVRDYASQNLDCIFCGPGNLSRPNGSFIELSGGNAWVTYGDEYNGCYLLPIQDLSKASSALSGVVVGGAVIVSRGTQSTGFEFSKSRIALFNSYKDIIYSASALEDAVKSYMDDITEAQAISDKYLHLTDAEVQAAYPYSAVVAYNQNNHTGNVTLNGRTDGIDGGSRYAYVTRDGKYVLQSENSVTPLTITYQGDDEAAVTEKLLFTSLSSRWKAILTDVAGD